MFYCVLVVLAGTEAEQSENVLMCPDDLISKIQPFINQTLVREFDCVYKFVVVDDNGAAIYHLDLKNGMLGFVLLLSLLTFYFFSAFSCVVLNSLYGAAEVQL